MSDMAHSRRIPFLWASATLAIVSIAVARLPESFVAQLRRNRPFDMSQSGWLYRLLVLVAIGQAFYVGLVALRTEKVGDARAKDPKLGNMSRGEFVRSIARTAAVLGLLTLVYGLSAFGLTGERGGFWLFVLVSMAQLAWYFRQVGQITEWLRFQPEFASGATEPEARSADPTGENDTT